MARRFVVIHSYSMLSRDSLGFAISILFICACVFLQVLGAPVGLIDLLSSDITIESSLSEGLTIASIKPEVRGADTAHYFTVSESSHYQVMFVELFFRPPLPS